MALDNFSILTDMYYFAKVAHFSSYSVAERELGVPKSRLSRHIVQLEEHLGVKLLLRSSRHFVLTDAGSVFLSHCARVVEEVERGVDAISQLQQTPRGTVRVACMVNANRIVLAPLLPDFLLEYPDISVQIVPTNKAVDLYDGDIDIALRVAPEIDEPDSVTVRGMWTTKQFLVAAPSLLDRYGPCTTLDELRLFPTLDISMPRGRHTWMLKSPEGRSVAFNHHPRLVSDDIETLRFAAHAGAGVCRLSERMIADDLESGKLQMVLPDWSLNANHVYLAFLSSKALSPAVRAFVDHICAAASKRVREWEAKATPAKKKKVAREAPG